MIEHRGAAPFAAPAVVAASATAILMRTGSYRNSDAPSVRAHFRNASRCFPSTSGNAAARSGLRAKRLLRNGLRVLAESGRVAYAKKESAPAVRNGSPNALRWLSARPLYTLRMGALTATPLSK